MPSSAFKQWLRLGVPLGPSGPPRAPRSIPMRAQNRAPSSPTGRACQGHGGGGKEREGRARGERKKKKKLTQKPQGIFCLFRILGREKIATVIQSIPDNHSLFTVCMQRWQAGSAARGRGMRNSPGSLRPLLLGPKKPSAAVPHSSTGGGGERPGAGEEGEAPGSGGTGAGQSWRGGESFIPAGPRSKPGLEMEPMARSARLVC